MHSSNRNGSKLRIITSKIRRKGVGYGNDEKLSRWFEDEAF